MLHEVDPAQLAAWESIPKHLTEALVEANIAIDDATERDGNGVTYAGLSPALLEAKERAIEALEAHPSTRIASFSGQWFRPLAMIEADGRKDRCAMCFKPRSGQLPLSFDAGGPQDAPPQRPSSHGPESAELFREAVDRFTGKRLQRNEAQRPSAAKPQHVPPPTPPRDVMPTTEAAARARDFLNKLKANR